MEYAWSIAQSYILPKPEIILKRRQNAGFKKKKNVFNNNCTYSPIVNYYQHSPDINISIYQSIFNQYINISCCYITIEPMGITYVNIKVLLEQFQKRIGTGNLKHFGYIYSVKEKYFRDFTLLPQPTGVVWFYLSCETLLDPSLHNVAASKLSTWPMLNPWITYGKHPGECQSVKVKSRLGSIPTIK